MACVHTACWWWLAHMCPWLLLLLLLLHTPTTAPYSPPPVSPSSPPGRNWILRPAAVTSAAQSLGCAVERLWQQCWTGMPTAWRWSCLICQAGGTAGTHVLACGGSIWCECKVVQSSAEYSALSSPGFKPYVIYMPPNSLGGLLPPGPSVVGAGGHSAGCAQQCQCERSRAAGCDARAVAAGGSAASAGSDAALPQRKAWRSAGAAA